MYSTVEREDYFKNAIRKIEEIELVEGIVQLGSGVTGYKDAYSDIDLMVCTSKEENTQATKDQIHQALADFAPMYIKEKKFSETIFLLIILLENGLEFNISIAPRDLLPVRSPLWRVVVDKTGEVLKKMNNENEKFERNPVKYDIYSDIAFEFFYCTIGLVKELKRNNFIYALKLLNTMRDYILHVQAMNESKKCHQFKAYETLDSSFIERYLSTFPTMMTIEAIAESALQVKELFMTVMEDSSVYHMDDAIRHLLG
ncbi:aminoglycoside 6-adenylyltransferase [Sporosarcina aquimarina]|uniref:aminoglycoside 6-adenylyltransferase n=1 Tax=Sporosarcina aquimarina TaxID=114975 RepID=UPI00203C620C|nr:aminoglycoside 6-adenylyltransferase [Sporosarcina aquimarina]MCM3758486.1 aminoglycoside 6-adenylyltransferase [Sporosarcina aquimarina]